MENSVGYIRCIKLKDICEATGIKSQEAVISKLRHKAKKIKGSTSKVLIRRSEEGTPTTYVREEAYLKIISHDVEYRNTFWCNNQDFFTKLKTTQFNVVNVSLESSKYKPLSLSKEVIDKHKREVVNLRDEIKAWPERAGLVCCIKQWVARYYSSYKKDLYPKDAHLPILTLWLYWVHYRKNSPYRVNGSELVKPFASKYLKNFDF